jgi:hypothetical protein
MIESSLIYGHCKHYNSFEYDECQNGIYYFKEFGDLLYSDVAALPCTNQDSSIKCNCSAYLSKEEITEIREQKAAAIRGRIIELQSKLWRIDHDHGDLDIGVIESGVLVPVTVAIEPHPADPSQSVAVIKWGESK